MSRQATADAPAELLGRHSLRWGNVIRLFHIVGVLVRFFVGGLAAKGVRRLPGIGRRLRPLPSPPHRFRQLLEDLGGTFVKFGQVLSLQPDLLPREYCDELFDLLDRMPPFELQAVEQIFREDFGTSPKNLFDRFDPEPFASASIGQVHRAALDGSLLAVKVRRPTAIRDFGGDIRLMRAAVWAITTFHIKSLEAFAVPIRGFINWTADELDYRTEARYMAEAHANAADRETAKVPALLPNLSSSRVLTGEFLSGTTLLEYLRSLERGDPAIEFRLSEHGFDPHRFAESTLENFLGDVFEHGVFHADLHPANLLILPDNVVGYVDFGITGVISSYGREHALKVILALSRRDLEDLFQSLLRVSEVTEHSDLTAFQSGLERLADDWFERRDGRSSLHKSYTLIMLDLIQLSRDCRLYPHEETLRYMRSVITVDGLISRFAPDYDVNEALERLSTRHLQSRALETTVSADRMIEAWIAGVNLMRDGPLRLDRFLNRLEKSSRQRSIAPDAGIDNSRERLARRAGHLALAVTILGLAAALGPLPARLGLTLFSAHLALSAIGIALLAWTGVRWLGSRR